MVNIDGLKKMVKELSENKDLPADGKETLISMANNLIRGDEIVRRFSEYFKNGYHFGYFLIQSQRIENTAQGLVEAAERLKALSEKRAVKNIDLNIPLGSLISVMEKYIRSEEVFKPLREFNGFRKQVVHRLYEDFSQDLSDIEVSVAENFPPEKINELQALLIKATFKINHEFVKQMDDSMFAKKLATQLEKQLLEEIGSTDIELNLI